MFKKLVLLNIVIQFRKLMEMHIKIIIMKGDFNRYIIDIVKDVEEKNQFYEESEGSYVKEIDRLKNIVIKIIIRIKAI